MHARKQLAQVIDVVIATEEVEADVDPSTVEEYKKLNDKCDAVIGKIKSRKKSKKQGV